MGRKPNPWWTVDVDYDAIFPYYVKAKDRDQARELAWKMHRTDKEVREHPERIRIIEEHMLKFDATVYTQLSKKQASEILDACGIKGRGRT